MQRNGEPSEIPSIEPQRSKSEENTPHSASEKMRTAQAFFKNLGLEIDESGLIANTISAEQLQKLIAWQKNTQDHDIIMPTESAIYAKVLLAVSLWRQQQAGSTQYLLGKGIGVEIALQGIVRGREKQAVDFPCRSHSDFELYGLVETPADADGQKTPPPYPPNFYAIFGAQERYPTSKTKGLSNLPPELLHQTAEVVDLGGIHILVPKLELLFLDKFMRKESTPRAQGYDYELLAQQYQLDTSQIHQYLDDFVIFPATEQIRQSMGECLPIQKQNIERMLMRAQSELREQGSEPTRQAVLQKVNEEMVEVVHHLGHRTGHKHFGLRTDLWIALHDSDLESETTVVQGYLDKVQEKIIQVTNDLIARLQSLHEQIETMPAFAQNQN